MTVSIKISAALFDFDGTLLDSERLHYITSRNAAAEAGINISEEEFFARYIGLTDRELFINAGKNSGKPFSEQDLTHLLTQKSKEMIARFQAGEGPFFPGVRECLQTLTEKNIPIGIVSGARRNEIEHILQQYNLKQVFQFIVSADDVSRGKPDPQGYLLGFEKLRSSYPHLKNNECFAFEDTPRGIAAAKAAGLKVVALTQTVSDDSLKNADHIVTGFTEIEFL